MESDQREVRRPTGVDLFSGVGGMSLGFEQAGFDVLASVELDPVHLSAHEANFPLCEPVCDDVTDLSGGDLLDAAGRGWQARYPDREFVGEIDCIFGGPSCQGFSVIGRQDPDDARNKLIFEFARLVGEAKPRSFVLENVPGLAAPVHAETLERLKTTLTGHGYSVAEPWLLNAKDFGVPQDRRRIFLVGIRDATSPIVAPCASTPSPYTVADALNDLPNINTFPSLFDSDAIRLTQGQRARMRAAQSEYARELNADAAGHLLEDSRNWDGERLTGLARTLHSEKVETRFRKLKGGERDAVGRLPRLNSNGQSPTLRAGTGRDHGSFTSARPIHPESNRVICVREAARLHGYPDWFQFNRTRWHGFRQIGNSVPPPLAFATASTLVSSLKLDPPKSEKQVDVASKQRLLDESLLVAAERYGLKAPKLPVDVRRQPKLSAEVETEAAA